MIRDLNLLETRRSVSPVWPSIAAASAELRRPRRLAIVRSETATPATTTLGARPRLTTVPRGR